MILSVELYTVCFSHVTSLKYSPLLFWFIRNLQDYANEWKGVKFQMIKRKESSEKKKDVLEAYEKLDAESKILTVKMIQNQGKLILICLQAQHCYLLES